MSEIKNPNESEYVSRHVLSEEELKTAIHNSSKFLSLHTRMEMAHYFDQDPWIGRQIAYYMKLVDEEKWTAANMIKGVLASEWKKHKKLMGYPDLTITQGVKEKRS